MQYADLSSIMLNIQNHTAEDIAETYPTTRNAPILWEIHSITR